MNMAYAGAAAVRIAIFLLVLLVASLWRIFKKAGRPGWPALVPFYNGYLTVEIAGKPGWWILLYFVPILGIVVAAKVHIALARNFGKSTGFGVGLLLLPFIFYPMLADGEAAYVAAVPHVGGARKVPGRRGALLSAALIYFLSFLVLGSGILLITSVRHGASPTGRIALLLAVDVAVAVALAAIWKWRK